MPGWSSAALTIQNVSGLFGSIIALLIGLRSVGGPPAGRSVR